MRRSNAHADPESQDARSHRRAKQTAEATKPGNPLADDTQIGPLAGKAQFAKVERLINKGLEEGATLVAGGLGKPDGITKGYFVKPTVFADVRNDMTIAREEFSAPFCA